MDEQQENINNTTSTNYTSPSIMSQQNQEFIKWQLENDEPIAKLESRLSGKGMVYNEEKQENELKQVANPMMNKDGVYWVIAAVEIFTDKIFQLSNFSQEEIDSMMEQFEHDLVDHLYAHYKEYELNIIANLRLIYTMITSTVFASVKRSLNAGTYKGLSLGTEHREVINTQPQQRKSWLQKLNL